ncbi:MAG: hypothetical protein GXO07_07105 [Crenarchaeota archaeon]|nr:hypothetical protein [Thermoproteota archaeon]
MKLRVKGLGPFDDVSLELGQLTVLVGVSGSGKGLLARTAKALYSAESAQDALLTIYDHLEPPRKGRAELGERAFDAERLELTGFPYGKAIYLSERRFVVPFHFVLKRYAEKVRSELEAEGLSNPLRVLAEMVENVVGNEFKNILLMSLRPTDYEASSLMDRIYTRAMEKVEEMFEDWKCTGALSAYLTLAALESDADLVVIDEPEALLNPGRAVQLIKEIVTKAKEKKVVATAELAHAVAAFQKFAEDLGIDTKVYAVAYGKANLIWES